MGRQYIQQCREGFLARSADLLGAFIDFLGSAEAAYDMARKYTRATKKEFPGLVELLEGMADEANLDYEEAVIVLYGKSILRTAQECSHVAAWGDATLDGHLITACNIDFAYDAREYLPAVLAFPKDGNAFICSDLFHRDSMNEKGLIVQGSGGQNAGEGDMQLADDRHMWNDVNIYVNAYCNTAKEAVQAYENWKYIVGCNQFFGDPGHDTYIMEFTAVKCAIRRAGDHGEQDYLIENNGYVSDEMQASLMTHERYWTDCLPRYWTVEKILKDNLGSITKDILREAEGCRKFFIPEGWSFDFRDDWGVNYWYDDDRNPFDSGWHEDWSLEHAAWPPECKEPAFKATMRHVMDANTLSYYLMKGEGIKYFSCNPGATGTFWKVQLGGGISEITNKARCELEMQLWCAVRDIEMSRSEDAERINRLDKGKVKMYEGINYQSLAICAGEYTNKDEQMRLFGKALSAFCAGQCYARQAQDKPQQLENY